MLKYVSIKVVADDGTTAEWRTTPLEISSYRGVGFLEEIYRSLAKSVESDSSSPKDRESNSSAPKDRESFLAPIKRKVASIAKNRKNKAREYRVLESCGCICRCPVCTDILNDQADCIDGGELVDYQCNRCGCVSVWTFDAAPVPVFLYVRPRRKKIGNGKRKRG